MKFLKNLRYNLRWLSIYKYKDIEKPKYTFYIGKREYGTPYFFPRSWKKYKGKKLEEAALNEYKTWSEKPFKSNKTLEDWIEYYSRHSYPVEKKLGIDLVPLGWKTKWGTYRFEWGPALIITIFKWQIAIHAVLGYEAWEEYLEKHYGEIKPY